MCVNNTYFGASSMYIIPTLGYLDPRGLFWSIPVKVQNLLVSGVATTIRAVGLEGLRSIKTTAIQQSGKGFYCREMSWLEFPIEARCT